MKEYKYDAFISYRHCELDKFVAENLHRILENYELPKNLKEKLNVQGKTFKRIFRDQEELPLASNLEDPIISALEDSKYLIVICSPRLKDSLWCKKEIQTFKKLRGRKNIFCVLIEGEPSDSFPEEVLYDEVETTKNGKTKIEKIMVEPLAADVRGENKKEVLKKIKEEKLRLAAAMYNIDYDDLRQRHKLRRQKRIICTSIIVAISCLLFALYTSIMLIKINSQQRILKRHQALSLAKDAENYLSKDNRYEAIKSSYQALTKFNGVKMPYTSDAEYALSEGLGLYDVGSSYKTISEIQTKGVADYIKTSVDNKYAAIYDESEEVTLFKTKSLEKIKTFNTNGNIFDEYSFTFIGKDTFAYVNDKGNINLVNVSDGKIIKEIKKEKSTYSSLKGDPKGKYLTYTDRKNLYIYNIKDNKLINKLSSKDDYIKDMYYSEDSNYVFVGSLEENYDINKEDHMKIHVIRTKDVKEINDKSFNAGYITGIFTKGDNAYFLLNKALGDKYTMIVVSYNFIDDDTNWTKTYEDTWGKFIIKSYAEGINNIAVANYDTVRVLDAKDGDTIETFNTSSEIINMYSFTSSDMYLVFLNNGTVNYLSMEYRKNIEYKGRYEFNLNSYSKVVQGESGFLLIPKNENRVILYDKKTNKDMKEEKIKLDYPSNDSIKLSEVKKIKKQYHIKNKNLVDGMFYDNKKEVLFVNYTNNDIAIYSVKDKKLLNTLTNVGKVNHYFGKDKYNRIYIGDMSDSYILDKNYNKVGHIKGLAKLEKDKVIISNNGKYYSVKIKNIDEIKKEAKEYLK